MESIDTKNVFSEAHSAIIFSSALIRQLESNELRLPATYIGVRQVRPAGGKQIKDNELKRKYGANMALEKTVGIDDHWLPNVINIQEKKWDEILGDPDGDGKSSLDSMKRDAIEYKVMNPDGTERRMTSKEKKKLKHEIKRAKHLERKEQTQLEVKERIRVEKANKRERKKLKWLAKKNKNQCAVDLKNEKPKENNEEKLSDEKLATSMQGDQDEETERKYRGNPPSILTPAATRLAIDMCAIDSGNIQIDTTTTVLDDDLAKLWAAQIQDIMLPAEKHREKEDMRPMPYRLVPEVWKRLRPKHLDAPISNSQHMKCTSINQQDYSISILRYPSPLHDESAFFIFKYLHQNFNLHLACGARFGCDYLLYDGQREVKHSFAGLRIHCVGSNDDDVLPLPSAYDMHGFVRAMNTARKLALLATVVKDKNKPGVARVAIVDLALEAILTAPTHVKKGNTDKRRCVESTNELKKHKS